MSPAVADQVVSKEYPIETETSSHGISKTEQEAW